MVSYPARGWPHDNGPTNVGAMVKIPTTFGKGTTFPFPFLDNVRIQTAQYVNATEWRGNSLNIFREYELEHGSLSQVWVPAPLPGPGGEGEGEE